MKTPNKLLKTFTIAAIELSPWKIYKFPKEFN